MREITFKGLYSSFTIFQQRVHKKFPKVKYVKYTPGGTVKAVFKVSL